MQQARAAIFLAALRRFCGPALSHGPRPSPSPSAPSWPSGLTLRSSRPAYGGRLTLPVSPLSNRFIQPMVHSPAFTFASVYSLGVLSCAGLRLRVLRRFQAFLASGACAVSASSYHFVSIAPPPWRGAFSQFAHVVKLGFPVLASVSNPALKRTATPPLSLVR